MSEFQRPLAGLTVNISVSESNDSEALGFPPWQVNRTTLQFVSALFGQGVNLVFGHDWRDDGVMEAVYGFARQVQTPIVSQIDVTSSSPPLQNLLPWPDSPFLSDKNLEQLATTVSVEAAGLPEELMPYEKAAHEAGQHSKLYRYLRARGLTHLRHRLTELSDARICVGGRRSGSAGRYPGVIEEALFALRSFKPLYVSSLLGGASRHIVDALEGRVMPADFCARSEAPLLYSEPPIQQDEEGAQADVVV